ncbi:cyclase family protein [Actinocorallia longicatena]|uniref:Kynurenine formamidase n=1 Tax=Actinocorallia longicatena TaxID=111803 RepID=A0ABP6QHX5_9ACTN
MTTDQWRVQFDADVEFANGGSLQAREFRLDIPGADISDEDLGALFVRHLGLLMVGSVRISAKSLINELHKGSRGAETAAGKRRLVELSHALSDGMITYPGLPAPAFGVHLSHEDSRANYAPGTEFHFARIEMVGNTGTYLDAPLHRYQDGDDLSGVPLGALADLDALVIRAGDVQVITRELLLPHDVLGRAVLIHTGHAAHWGTDAYAVNHPYVSAEAAEWLVAEGAALVGIDSLNIDGTSGGERPAHTALLAAGIPIVEHMTGLEQLPPHGFRFHAAPPMIVGVGTFPVRAYAVITEE